MVRTKSISILFFFVVVLVFGLSAQEAMIIDPAGNVGINTNTPTEKLDVDGNINVSGTVYGNIISDSDYESWAVGQYYSKPYDLRDSWDFTTSNLSHNWTLVDFSGILPQGVKRVRVFIDIFGTELDHHRLLLQARPAGSIAVNWHNTGVILLDIGNHTGSTSRVSLELEIDVNENGQFEIKEYTNSAYRISEFYMQLRGFYK